MKVFHKSVPKISCLDTAGSLAESPSRGLHPPKTIMWVSVEQSVDIVILKDSSSATDQCQAAIPGECDGDWCTSVLQQQ